ICPARGLLLKRKDTEMKNTIAALILVAAAASPAMAGEAIESAVPTYLSAATAYSSEGYHAYASSPRVVTGSVVQHGAYAYTDPDVNVRLHLEKQADIIDR